MLGSLDALLQQYGLCHRSLFELEKEIPSPGTFARHFGSLDGAFQQLHRRERDGARDQVREMIRRHVPEVLPYSDFLVLDRKLTVAIQPAVPILRGYGSYWPFRADPRGVIDITLGVLLSDGSSPEILGYVALPRWLTGGRTLRFHSASTRIELFGRTDLAFLQQLL
jgi:hypothetical protein